MKLSTLIMILAICTTGLSAQFAGGSGKLYDPYQVLTVDHLALISSYRDAHFVQLVDLDISLSPYATGAGWIPIGSVNEPFTGSYNGDGFQISNLMINRMAARQGMFGFAENASFQNINLRDVDITGSNMIGALLGRGEYCQVINCSVNGRIHGLDCIGAMIGDAWFSLIHTCTVDLAIQGNEAVGGISGWAYNTKIRGCSSHFSQSSALYGLGGIAGYCFNGTEISGCTFSGQLYCGGSGCGGIAAEAHFTTIEDCQVLSGTMLTGGGAGGILGKGEVSVQIINCHSHLSIRGLVTAGGLAGWLGGYSSIETSFSTGDVEGYYYIGGLVGSISYSSAIDCYATGNVDGYQYVGGFLGSMSSNGVLIRNCYSIGAVTAGDSTTSGGFVGLGYANQAVSCYWNTETSGWDQSPAGEGRTTQEMIFPYGNETYTDWDFSRIWSHDLTHQNGGYPYLQFGVTPVQEQLEQVPPAPVMFASPNPFKKELRIKLNSPIESHDAYLKVYDIRGRKINCLKVHKGSSDLVWDGKDGARKTCPSGIYILSLETNGTRGKAIKVTLLR
ncbi:MAG: GLUG motif-containing protein [Candidatus Cloacimonadaceae bacterium]|nr:GLUG motif-containing protein [Candidatus Cloacimonadaceae bacterium]